MSIYLRYVKDIMWIVHIRIVDKLPTDVSSYVDYRFGTGTNQYSNRERIGKSTKKNPKYKTPAI